VKNEIQVLLAAISFYTRLPLPKTFMPDVQAFSKASKYLPFVGWLVGCLQVFVFVALYLFFPLRVAVVCAMIAGIMITGALHEDGFIDCCDAFGAGKGKDETLHIMKDSRVGAFGVIGYIALFFLKIELFVAMAECGIAVVILGCIAAHSLSRLMAFWFIVTDHYVCLDDVSSKSKMLVSGIFEQHEILFAIACGFVPLLFLQSFLLVPLLLCLLIVLKRLLGAYFVRRIGGYTGDCLGAVQQISELLVYMSIVLIWNCI
jgi:adenosylcobinamide-GDP ribazoletransferase